MRRLLPGCASGGLRCRYTWHRLRTLDRTGPCQDFETTVRVFPQSRAALNPIAAFHLADTVLVTDRRIVKVAADHAVSAVALGFSCESLLEGADVVDGILHLQLRPLRQRPVRHAEQLAERV